MESGAAEPAQIKSLGVTIRLVNLTHTRAHIQTQQNRMTVFYIHDKPYAAEGLLTIMKKINDS